MFAILLSLILSPEELHKNTIVTADILAAAFALLKLARHCGVLGRKIAAPTGVQGF